MTQQAYVTPVVAKLAAQHDVNLAAVTGSGVGGRIRKSDVLAAAGVTQTAASATPSALRQAAAGAHHAANPLVDRARQSGRTVSASTSAAAPTLFQSGDLPPFMASGLDPQLLTQVPAAARHPMARAATAQDAYAILEAYSGPNGAEAAANDFRYDDGNLDYESRVIAWAGPDALATAAMPETNPWAAA